MLHFDGATWSDEPPPPEARSLGSMSVGADGEIYIIVQLGSDGPSPIAHRRARGAAWEMFEVPTVRFPDRGLPKLMDHIHDLH